MEEKNILKKYFMEIQINNIKKPISCKECPFSDHEAWCLIPGDWRIRYYCPDDEISEDCPIWIKGDSERINERNYKE